MRDTAVVVPCYNESQRLDVEAFRAFAREHADVSFLFVNDGSTDGTQELLENLCRADPDSFRLLRLERNSGKAEAVRRGVLRAFESDPVYVGYWDADLATPLDLIRDFRVVLEDRQGVDLVLGSRVRLLGREVCRTPKRHYLGRIFATVSSLVLGLSVYDTQCGAKLFRSTPTTRSLFDEPFRSTWIFDVEVLARLVRARQQARQPGAERVMFEFPLTCWREVGGSKLKPRDFLRAPLELLAIYRRYLADLGSTASPASSTPRPYFARKRATVQPGPGAPHLQESLDRTS